MEDSLATRRFVDDHQARQAGKEKRRSVIHHSKYSVLRDFEARARERESDERADGR